MSQTSTARNQLVVGYWTVRGLVEPIRLVLHYTKTPFTDKLYELGEGPEYSQEEWLSEKENLGLDFPNLPYLFDGDLKITQSRAILYYLGRKLNLMGKTPNEQARVMVLCEEAHDLRMKLTEIFHGPGATSKEERKKFAETTLSDHWKKFDNYFGKHNTKFAIDDEPTVADFQLFSYIDSALILDEDDTLIEKYSNIKRYLKTISELPEIKDYIIKSHAKYPVSNKVAKYGGKVIEKKLKSLPNNSK